MTAWIHRIDTLLPDFSSVPKLIGSNIRELAGPALSASSLPTR